MSTGSIKDKLIQFSNHVNKTVDKAFDNKWFCLMAGLVLLAGAGVAFHTAAIATDHTVVVISAFGGTGLLIFGAMLCRRAYLKHIGSPDSEIEFLSKRIVKWDQRTKAAVVAICLIASVAYLLVGLKANGGHLDRIPSIELGALSVTAYLLASLVAKHYLLKKNEIELQQRAQPKVS